MNISQHIKEIHNIGCKLDEIQDSFSSGTGITGEIVSDVKILDDYFEQPMPYEDDLDYKIVYYYTKANYLTVILEIASENYGELQDEIETYRDFSSFDDMNFELTLRRITFLRNSISLYIQSKDSLISTYWMAQVHTNLANLYFETGRILEALEELEEVKFDNGMAMGNYAAKLFELYRYPIDKSEQKQFLIDALNHYDLVIEKGKDDASVYPAAYESFLMAESYIRELLDTKYKEVSVYKDIPDDYAKEIGIEDNKYRKWCKEKKLALSFRNITEHHSNTDDMHLPNLGISYYSKNDKFLYYSWFNTIKQEFNMARYILFENNNKDEAIDRVHESQEKILLINTLDYPAMGYRTEQLKIALKIAYGVLDKIGLICSNFIKGESPNKVSRISFTSWFFGLEKEIALHSEFSALYWLARDLDFKNGSFKTFRRLRNVVEHRFLRILDHVSTSIENELEDDNKVEYKISYDTLQEQTWKVIKLVRNAIMYLVLAFNACYKFSMKGAEKNGKIFIPIVLDIYEDEWKN